VTNSVREKYELTVKKAIELNVHILFSYTESINVQNPQTFYSSANQMNHKEHFFWKDPQNETILIGFGNAHQIRTGLTDERFDYVQKEWDKLIDLAQIYNPYYEYGTGPLLFGGFTFDPLSMKEKEWEAFSNATFQIPQFMFTLKANDCFLTVNMIVTPHDDLKTFEFIERSKMQILCLQDTLHKTESLVKSQEEINPVEWKISVAKAIKLLRNGHLNKVVLARKMKMTFVEKVTPNIIFEQLWEQQHESYLFSYKVMNDCFIGASPERLVKKIGEEVLSTCLAGSIKRSSDENVDNELGKSLLEDKKNRHEHQLVVSMIADVFKEHCTEVNIPSAPILMKTRDIQHLYTPVRGEIKDSTSILEMVKSLHPTPALGGTPSQDAMGVIREIENMDRGLYAGPIGWMDYRGNGEFIVGIRSGLLKNNEAFIYAGCGIVADSNPEDEYLETKIKFRPMLRAFGGKEI
jgi:menaquinone-specific isochorismate synthase